VARRDIDGLEVSYSKIIALLKYFPLGELTITNTPIWFLPLASNPRMIINQIIDK